VPSEQTTAASMQSVKTLRDHSIVAARMGLLEMASIALVTMNVFFINLHLFLTP